MSGISLAVAPRSDPDNATEKQTVAATMLGGVMGSLRVIELQLVAFIMVFSASGLVPAVDLLFPLFATVYLVSLSRFVFPRISANGSRDSKENRKRQDGEVFRGSRFFQAYVMLGTTIGLFLPLAHVLGGFARGDEGAVRSVTPHLFLLSCQILTENVIGSLGLFSPPVRALVPLLYTVRRVFVILDWVCDMWVNKTIPRDAPIQELAWLWFGRVLSLANLIYFSINLFGFLIPQFLPRAFEKYFRMRDEVSAKTKEDKRERVRAPVQSSEPSEAKREESKKAD